MLNRWWLLLGIPVLLAPGTWGTLKIDPTLSNPTSDGVTVRWEMRDNRSGLVEYGTSATNLSESVENANLLSTQEFKLTGLQPGTQYFYKASSFNSAGVPSLQTQVYSFRTAPKRNDTWGFVFAADAYVEDNASPAASIEEFSTWIGNQDPDVMLHAGNHVDAGQNTEDWEEYFDRMGPVYAEVPLLTTWGGADKTASGNAIGEANELATLLVDLPDNERLWSTSYGNTLIIGLELDWGYDGRSDATVTWLDGVLADASDGVADPRYIVVMTNPSTHPTRSNGGCGNRSAGGQWAFEKLKPLFEQYDVSLVLTGENRAYTRSVENDVTYVSVVTSDKFEGKDCDPTGLAAHKAAPSMVGGSVSCNEMSLEAYVFNGTGFGDFWTKTGESVEETFTVLPRPATACSYDVDNDGVDDSTDCDDNDPAVKPGANEVCTGGKDEDCDGLVDDDDDDCDEPDDTDTDTDSDTDTDEPSDSGSEEDSGDVVIDDPAQLGCTCSSTGGGGSLAWVALLGLLAVRRRR